MAHTMANEMGFTGTESRADSAAYQAYQILRLGFTVAPIIAGLDKFLHLLVDWDKYLAPFVSRLVGGRGQGGRRPQALHRGNESGRQLCQLPR